MISGTNNASGDIQHNNIQQNNTRQNRTIPGTAPGKLLPCMHVHYNAPVHGYNHEPRFRMHLYNNSGGSERCKRG